MLRLVALAALISAALVRDEDAGRKVALVVGVNAYQNPSFPPLEFAENDATELARELTRGGFDVTLLTGSAPTAANVRKALAELLAGRSRRDTVLVALAGHGVQAEVDDPDRKGPTRTYPFFCPADADLAGISYSTGNSPRLLNLNGVLSHMGKCPAGTKLLLTDACRNVVKVPVAARSLDRYQVTVPPGVGVMFSCSPRQCAYEASGLGGKGHGVFFHFVLEGLRGKAVDDAGVVSWDGLGTYVTRQVSREVPKLLRSDRARQTPQVLGTLPTTPVLTAARPASGEDDYQRGLDHLWARGTGFDAKAAARHLKRAADAGHALARAEYATLLVAGVGSERDADAAARLARESLAAVKAQAARRPEAMALMGDFHLLGLGVEADPKEAARWFAKAADAGLPYGSLAHAQRLLAGDDTTGDAARLLRRAADAGLPEAMVELGQTLERGDARAAVAWFRKAADAGHPAGQYHLGRCHADGVGVTRSAATAVALYKRSAAQGFAMAEVALASSED